MSTTTPPSDTTATAAGTATATATTATTTTATIPDDLISVCEAARLLPSRKPGRRMHYGTLYRWIREGRLQGWRVGSHWFVSRREVVALPVPSEVRPEVATRARREREIAEAQRYLRDGGNG